MVGKRKRYSADFKAKVALEALRGELTTAQLATKHGIHQTMVSEWKKQAVEGLTTVFSGMVLEQVQNHGRGCRPARRGWPRPSRCPPSARSAHEVAAARIRAGAGADTEWRGRGARRGRLERCHTACRCWARPFGSSLLRPSGQRAGTRLEHGDFGFEQFPLKQHLAEPRLQPSALQCLAVGGPGRQARLSGG